MVVVVVVVVGWLRTLLVAVVAVLLGRSSGFGPGLAPAVEEAEPDPLVRRSMSKRAKSSSSGMASSASSSLGKRSARERMESEADPEPTVTLRGRRAGPASLLSLSSCSSRRGSVSPAGARRASRVDVRLGR